MQTNRAPPIKGLTSSNFPGRKKKKKVSYLEWRFEAEKRGRDWPVTGSTRAHTDGGHRCGTIGSPTAHRRAITFHRAPTIAKGGSHSSSHPSDPLHPPRPSSRRFSTLLLLPISISDRLAPTSQECDTSRNSFELHISLAPREITAAAVKLAMWIHGAREYLKIR